VFELGLEGDFAGVGRETWALVRLHCRKIAASARAGITLIRTPSAKTPS
jgi:hypothetical protein